MKNGRGRRRGSKTLQKNAAEMLGVGYIMDLGLHRYRVSSPDGGKVDFSRLKLRHKSASEAAWAAKPAPGSGCHRRQTAVWGPTAKF